MCLVGPALASADSGITVHKIEQRDPDRDGRPELTVLDYALSARQGRIVIVDQGDDMRTSADWRQATDFSNDVWLMDQDSDAACELVIQFSPGTGGLLQASLWDDQDNSGQVEVSIDGASVRITESPFPTLVVSTTGDWPDGSGRLSGDLSFRYDGIRSGAFEDVLSRFLRHDGQFDYETRIVDGNNDGLADFVHSRILPLIPEVYAVPREGLFVNIDARAPEPSNSYLFWPLLNYEPGYVGKNYFSTPPFVQIDWEAARIGGYGIAGYPIEAGYHVNNLNRWEQNVANQADFENAMSYYDLADNHDGLPELHVRHVYWPRNDPFHPGNASFDINEVVYSWRMGESRELAWDYKVAVLGRNRVDSIVPYDAFSLYAVPYGELPRWVIRNRWDIATFVAVEDRDYVSGEGIYEWSVSEGVINDVAASPDSPQRLVPGSGSDQALCMGGGDCELGENYVDIAVGLRGEYGRLGRQPILYFSPIDRRLHLAGAERGVWRLDEGQVIRMANMDGDDHIDVWSREAVDSAVAGPTVIETLYALGGRLMHTEGAKITVVASDYRPALFDTLPPVDHETWEAQRAQLAACGTRRRDPTDLKSWLAAFAGPRGEISGASLAHVRIIDDGFRFELTLKPAFQVAGADLLGAAGLAPGDYVVENHDGAFTVAPLVPAQLSLVVRQAAGESAAAAAHVTVRNTGLADAPGLTLVAEAAGSNGAAIELARTTVDAPAGQTAQVLVVVPPTIANGTGLRVYLEEGEGRNVAETIATYTGNSNSPAAPVQVLSLSAAPGRWPGWLSALIALAAFPALALVRRPPAGPRGGEE